MAYSKTLTAFAQSVYLAIKNRHFDDIDGADGQNYIAQVIDWFNNYLDELETVVDAFGQPVDWDFMRSNSFELGKSVTGASSISIDDTIFSVIATPKRPVTITVGGEVVSSWMMVKPNQLDPGVVNKYVTHIGGTLYFNHPFTALENGGTINGDVTISIPRISDTGANSDVLTTIKPRQLLVLGVAKNASLPDIVQGGLSPSFVQKYNDLLTSAILMNNDTSTADTLDRDDFSFIKGIGF